MLQRFLLDSPGDQKRVDRLNALLAIYLWVPLSTNVILRTFHKNGMIALFPCSIMRGHHNNGAALLPDRIASVTLHA